jgi:hypothetical protein
MKMGKLLVRKWALDIAWRWNENVIKILENKCKAILLQKCYWCSRASGK